MKSILYKTAALLSTSCFALAVPAQVLKIAAGTQVVNQSTITLQNVNLVNDGVFSNPVSGSHVKFSGGTDQTVSGTGTTSFYSLTPAKTSGAKIIFQKPVSVAGAISMGSGLIDLTNTTMTLLPTAVIYDESESSRITASGTGELVMTLPLNNVLNLNPGGMGLTISTQNNLGATTIRRGHQPQTQSAGEQSIGRYFSFEPTTNSGLSVSLRFTYLDAELNNLVETGLQLHQKEGAGNWTALQASGVSNVLNFREVSNLQALHRYTLFGHPQATLPLQLLAFDVRCKDGAALLQWITANEVNTNRFVVEKSNDGITWAPAQNLLAGGYTAQQTYTATVAGSNAAYYRLKMEDKDGKFTYSPVKKMTCDGGNLITVGPNPTTGPLTISFQLTQKDNGTIQLSDAKGSLLQSRAFNAAQGLSVETIDMSRYPSGTYLVRITSAGGLQETKQVLKR